MSLVKKFFIKRGSAVLATILALVLLVSAPLKVGASGSAGLFAQFYPGNYKIDVIQLHNGWAGPWNETQNILHTNIHVWEKSSRGNYSIHKANLHISARTNLAGSICWYVHDTVNNTSKTNCHPLLAITEAKEAMQEEVKAQLNKATNWEVAVTVGVVVAIVVIAWATWPASAIALVAAARSAGDQPEGNSEQPPIDTGSDELSAPPNEKAQEPDESKKAPGVPVESETVPGIPPNEDIPENE